MKQLISILLIFNIQYSIFNIQSKAQSYTFSFTKNNPYTSNLPLATSLNNGMTWDSEEYHIPIGFIFYFFDQPFDSIYIRDYVRFKVNGDYRIYPFFVNFIDRDTINGGYINTGPTPNSVSPVSCLLDGSPGNRILKIEWVNAGFLFEMLYLGTLNDRVNLQLWLYEGSNDIEVHIGPNAVISPASSYNGNEGAQVGILYSPDTIVLTGPADSPLITSQFDDHITGTPTSGIIYKFSNNFVGIDSKELLPELMNIYPNPGRDVFTISTNYEFNTNLRIMVYDVLGREVYKSQVPSPKFQVPRDEIKIDLSMQPAGIYFIQLQSDKGLLNRKIVVQ